MQNEQPINTIGDKAGMSRKQATMKKQEYEEMERGGLSAAFRRPPWHLTAARMERKEKKDGTGKKTDGRDDVKKLGAGGRGIEGDRRGGQRARHAPQRNEPAGGCPEKAV